MDKINRKAKLEIYATIFHSSPCSSHFFDMRVCINKEKEDLRNLEKKSGYTSECFAFASWFIPFFIFFVFILLGSCTYIYVIHNSNVGSYVSGLGREQENRPA